MPILKRKMKMLNLWCILHPVKKEPKHESFAIRRVPTPLRRRKEPPVWRDPSATLEQDVSGTSAWPDQKTSRVLENSDGEALQKIINKLSDVRNLKDLHLKHHHMSSAQFKKRTTHLDFPGKLSDLYKHVVKTCPSCNSKKRRPDRSRVCDLRAEEFGDLIFLDHRSAKIGDKTFGFLLVLDGATSQLTAYPCKSTTPSEVISKVHECMMDTFQVNPKAIRADMAFHHPHDMQAFYRMHNIKRFLTGPHTL